VDSRTGGIRPVSSLSRTCKAVWNILHQEGKASHVVGWWPSHPSEPIRGCMVSNHFQQAQGPLDRPWPVHPGSVHPPENTFTEDVTGCDAGFHAIQKIE